MLIQITYNPYYENDKMKPKLRRSLTSITAGETGGKRLYKIGNSGGVEL